MSTSPDEIDRRIENAMGVSPPGPDPGTRHLVAGRLEGMALALELGGPIRHDVLRKLLLGAAADIAPESQPAAEVVIDGNVIGQGMRIATAHAEKQLPVLIEILGYDSDPPNLRMGREHLRALLCTNPDCTEHENLRREARKRIEQLLEWDRKKEED